MAGSESDGEQSRKRRISQITPDKSKKASKKAHTGLFSTPTEINSSKPTQMNSTIAKPSTFPGVSATKGLGKIKEKTGVPIVQPSPMPKAPKTDGIVKTKVKSEKIDEKAKKPDENGKATSKKGDGKVKKHDSKDKKEGAMDVKPDMKERKDGKETNPTNSQVTPKASPGVKLPDLVRPDPSNSEDFDDDMSDSDSSDDSSDSDDMSYVEDYCDSDLFEEVKAVCDDYSHLSAERRVEEKAKTLRHVKTFVDTSKDKHYHEFHFDNLTGPTNYSTWLVSMEILLRMHQVWPVVGELSVPLDKEHELYPWYEHMISVAVSLIYGHVSQELRSQRCFVASALKRSPSMMMQHLWAHYSKENAEAACL